MSRRPAAVAIASLWAATATAQPAPESPARACADAAAGAEVETCLEIAAAHPEAIPALAAALRAHVDREAADDRAIFDALLRWLDGDERAGAALRGLPLGAARDPATIHLDALRTRLVPLIAQAIRSQPGRAAEAAEILLTLPDGLRALGDLLDDPTVGPDARAAIATAMAATADPEAADRLTLALRTRAVRGPVRRHVLDEVRTHFPDRVRALPPERDPLSEALVATTGAAGLGFTLEAVRHIGRSPLIGLGATTGALAGAAGGTAWAQIGGPVDRGDAAFTLSTELVATSALSAIGAGFSPGDADLAFGLGLGGVAAGIGAGSLLAPRYNGTWQDATEATFVAGAMGLGTLALVDRAWDGPRDVIDPAPIAAGFGTLAGGVVGHALAPQWKTSPSDWATIGVGAAWGGVAFRSFAARTTALSAVEGMGIGASVGVGVAMATELPMSANAGAAAGLLYGGATGFGVGTALSEPFPESRDPLVRWGTFAGATLGLAGGALVGARNPGPVHARDVALATAASGFFAWQGAGWALALVPAPAARGALIAGPAVAGAAVASVSRFLDVPIDQTLAASSVGAWGGGIGAVVQGLRGEDPLPGGLVGSAAGVALGATLVSPAVRVPPRVILFADLGGVGVGAASVIASTILDRGDTDAARIAGLIGAGAGLAGGAAIGAVVQSRSGGAGLARAPALPGQLTIAPMAVAGGQGVMIRLDGW